MRTATARRRVRIIYGIVMPDTELSVTSIRDYILVFRDIGEDAILTCIRVSTMPSCAVIIHTLMNVKSPKHLRKERLNSNDFLSLSGQSFFQWWFNDLMYTHTHTHTHTCRLHTHETIYKCYTVRYQRNNTIKGVIQFFELNNILLFLTSMYIEI